MPASERIPEKISVLESLSHEHFTPEELADLLGIGVSVVREAVRRGDLQGYTVDHRIIDITRHDAIAWLKERLNSSQ